MNLQQEPNQQEPNQPEPKPGEPGFWDFHRKKLPKLGITK